MRKQFVITGLGVLAAVTISGQAMALGMGDLAKVVLGGGSVLKKADQKCGSSLGLTGGERLKLESAYSAVRSALSKNEFTALNTTATSAAETESQSPTFCDEAKKKKSGLLSKIGKAAKGLVKKRIGLTG